MNEKLELCKYINTNSKLPMRLLAKKSIGWLRSMKERIDSDKRESKFNKSMGYTIGGSNDG